MDFSKPWREYTFTAFDTETSGKFPLVAEIVEVAAVKWRDGKVIEEFQTLVKPINLMGEAVIKIHNITNEMVVDAPPMKEILPLFNEFIKDTVLIAHHAAFDLGFLAYEFEKLNMPFPDCVALDTLALSRKAYPKSHNHRLMTLVTLLNVKLEQAHRALADSQACLEVAIQCMEKLGPSESLEFMFKAQEGPFHWTRFSMSELLKVEHLSVVVKASMSQLVIEIEYQGGTQPGKPRRITPQGVVRNMTGDYVVGLCHIENIEKRFYLNRILSAKILD